MEMIYKIAVIFPLICIFALVKSQNDDDKSKVRFFFYPNSSNVSDRVEYKLDDISTITNSNFNRNKPVKVLIHGASASCTERPFPLILLEAYLQDKLSRNVDYNVICVDWGSLASGDAVKRGESTRNAISRNTVTTGTQAAILLKTLKDNGLIGGYSDVHVIGHSLGAHTSGITGLRVQQSNNFTEKVGRISGIDAAGVFYRDQELDLDKQIDLSDATFVDITHTNDKQVGFEGKYGHADFYPDGGEHQKECFHRGIPTAVLEGVFGACSHVIGPEYWATSILYRNITACKVNSYSEFKRVSKCETGNLVNFGDSAPTNIFGRYYFDV